MPHQTVMGRPTSLLHYLPSLLGLAILSPVLGQDVAIPQAEVQLVNNSQLRVTRSESELRRWLENMWVHHHYSLAEMTQVTGKSESELRQLIDHFSLEQNLAAGTDRGKLFVLPYPGGRHPRIGFLEGAIDPQRETKLSVFAPWDQRAYAVIDVPEAIWSNLGLTYLAHTHIPTIWSGQNINLPQQEWQQLPDGNFESVRVLPNGIEFGVKVIPLANQLRMKMWLTNGSERDLSDLRVQNCVMLKGLPGFETQTNDNKLFDNGYALAFSEGQQRWVITAWDPVHRNWGNANCPCIHSDPQFDDCPVGQTKFLRGWFSYYEGSDIRSELARIEATGWRTHPLHHRGVPVK